ncbi:NAD-dependent epimerase/dehydratase family protein [Tsukamurella soli]|uniref:SDR family oxidoreductase n=1 Tax=Tsukamurella soli TaxID=644556 RepID=A0ABP8JKV5_9ACTN
MHVLITGAGGHIGSAIVAELLRAGHQVTGLVRSEASAATVMGLGARVLRADLGTPDGLAATVAALGTDGADRMDAVIHLAFDHAAVSAGDMAGAARSDLAVVHALGDALAGTDRALVAVGMTPIGDPASDAAIEANPRSAVAKTVAGLADRGVRSVLVGVPPVTHSADDRHGFVPTLIGIARRTGVSGYLGDGTNRWPAAHTRDVARLFAAAVERAPAGAGLSAAAEEGIEVRAIAEAIGRRLGVPTVSVAPADAATHFGHFAPFAALDIAIPGAAASRSLGWTPVQPGLLADLDEGHYFDDVTV